MQLVSGWSRLKAVNTGGDLFERNYIPMSVPIPRTLPRMAINADSPPELPPGDRSVLWGLVVVPYKLLTVSNAYDLDQYRVFMVTPWWNSLTIKP